MTRKNYPSNKYNPYWMISNSIANNKAKSINNDGTELKGTSNETINKDIKNHNTMGTVTSRLPLNYHSFNSNENDDIIINNQVKSIFSLFNKCNQENSNLKNDDLNDLNNLYKNNAKLKRNESILNLTNVFNNNNNTIQKLSNSYSSSTSSIYSSNYNYDNNDDNNSNNNYNKVVLINTSSNKKHINNKNIDKTNGSKDSNFEDSKKNSNDSSLIDSSTIRTSETSSMTNNSEKHFFSSPVNHSESDSKLKIQNQLKTHNQGTFEHINVKLRFKNLYLSKRISHKIPAKNIEYLNRYKKQYRINNNSYINSSSDEFPKTLYTFRQINVRFPKQYKNLPIENHKIHTFKDNNSINKGTRNIMEKVHHKKNANNKDYMFTIECLNTITTDKNTIKSVMKYNDLVKSFKNNSSHLMDQNMTKDIQNELDKNLYSNNYKCEDNNDIHQTFTNKNDNHNHLYRQYESEFINNDLKTGYSTELNNKKCYPNQNSETIESYTIEKHKQNIQQELIQQIQEQSIYYQENKLDYSYSCTTLSSFTDDESYLESGEDDYCVPDISKNYNEVVVVTPNSMSPVSPLSFKKHKSNYLPVKSPICSIANNKLNFISESNNFSVSSTSKFDLEEESQMGKRRSIKLKREDQIAPFFQNDTLKSITPNIHNTNFKLYDSDATESISSSYSSSVSTDNNKGTKYINSLSNFIYHKPFYNSVENS